MSFVRGQSFFGLSFVYVIFQDGTDMYWARSRVLEYLNEVQGSLPEGVTPTLGPDATGVGWVFEYALVDESGNLDLQQLRSLQDWNLRYALEGIEMILAAQQEVREEAARVARAWMYGMDEHSDGIAATVDDEIRAIKLEEEEPTSTP